jgi:hypothetical protein
MNGFKHMHLFVMLLGLAICGSLAVQSTAAQAKKKTRVKYYSVKTGTTLRVRMEDSLSSKTARAGDRFRTTTVDPIYSSGGVLLIPAASTVKGVVTASRPAKKDGEPGTITVSFTSITLPNRRSVAINGFLTSLDEGSSESDDEGIVSGKKISRRNIKFIGGGAGGGLLIGAMLGGGKGALIGAGIGAVGGFFTKKLVKGKEAEVEDGTEFGVYLSRAISLPRY